MPQEIQSDDCHQQDEANRLKWEEIFAQTPAVQTVAVMELIRNLAADLQEQPLIIGAQLTYPAIIASLAKDGLLNQDDFGVDERSERIRRTAESIARVSASYLRSTRPGTYIPDAIRTLVQEAFLRLDNETRNNKSVTQSN